MHLVSSSMARWEISATSHVPWVGFCRWENHRTGCRITGWWFQPLWQIWKSVGQLGLLFPIHGQIKMFQTTTQNNYRVAAETNREPETGSNRKRNVKEPNRYCRNRTGIGSLQRHKLTHYLCIWMHGTRPNWTLMWRWRMGFYGNFSGI